MDLSRPKRDRSANFSSEDTHMLVNIIYKYATIIENKTTNAIMWHKKEEAWKKVTAEFNTLRSMKRTVKMLKIKYDGLKRALKKKTATNRLQSLNNTNDKEQIALYTNFEEKILTMMAMGFETMQERENDKSQRAVTQITASQKNNVTDYQNLNNYTAPLKLVTDIQEANKINGNGYSLSEDEDKANDCMDSSLDSWIMQTSTNNNTAHDQNNVAHEDKANDNMDYSWDLRTRTNLSTTPVSAKVKQRQSSITDRHKNVSISRKEFNEIELQFAVEELRKKEKSLRMKEQDLLNKAQNLINIRQRLNSSNVDIEKQRKTHAIKVLNKQKQLEFSVLENARREKEHSMDMLIKEKELEFAILENERKEKEHRIMMQILQYKLCDQQKE